MLFPHVESRQIVLSPAGVENAAEVYDIVFRSGRDVLPMIDTFVKNFGQGLSAGFLVRRKDAEEVVGFSTLSNLTPAGHLRADVSLLAGQTDEVRRDAIALTVNFAFTMWRTRKLYFHTTEVDDATLGFGAEHSVMVRTDAVLPLHAYFHGRLWDVQVLAIDRDQWDTYGVDLLKQIV